MRPCRRQEWRKIQIGFDAKMLEIRAAEMNGNRIGDAPVLPDVLNQVPLSQNIDSVRPMEFTTQTPVRWLSRHLGLLLSSRRDATPEIGVRTT